MKNTNAPTTVQVASNKTVTKANGSTEAFSVAKLRKRVDVLLDGLAVEHMSLDVCLDKVVKYSHSGKLINLISSN